MKTRVKQTSIDSIREHRASGKSMTQKQRVLDFIKNAGFPQTRRQVFAGLNFGVRDIEKQIEYGTVCGRVNSLVKEGCLIESGIAKNKTNKSAALLSLPEWENEMAA